MRGSVSAVILSLQLPSPTGTSHRRVHSSWIFCPSPDGLVDNPSQPAGILTAQVEWWKAFSLSGHRNRPNFPLGAELFCSCGWHETSPWDASLAQAGGAGECSVSDWWGLGLGENTVGNAGISSCERSLLFALWLRSGFLSLAAGSVRLPPFLHWAPVWENSSYWMFQKCQLTPKMKSHVRKGRLHFSRSSPLFPHFTLALRSLMTAQCLASVCSLCAGSPHCVLSAQRTGPQPSHLACTLSTSSGGLYTGKASINFC